jgi:hypothetical protein
MLYCGKGHPTTHCTGGWVGLRAGLGTEAKGKIQCICQGGVWGFDPKLLSNTRQDFFLQNVTTVNYMPTDGELFRYRSKSLPCSCMVINTFLKMLRVFINSPVSYTKPQN